MTNFVRKLVSSILVVTMSFSTFSWGKPAGQNYLRVPAGNSSIYIEEPETGKTVTIQLTDADREGIIDLVKEVMEKTEGVKVRIYSNKNLHKIITAPAFISSYNQMIGIINTMVKKNNIDKEKFAANEEFTKEVAMILNLVSYGQIQKKNAAKYLAKVYYEKMNKKKEKYSALLFGSSKFEQEINTIFAYISMNYAKKLSLLLKETLAEKFENDENKIFDYSINLLERETGERVKFYLGFDNLGGNILRGAAIPRSREKMVEVIARMIVEGIIKNPEEYKNGEKVLNATIILVSAYPPSPSRPLVYLADLRKIIDPKQADKYFGIKKGIIKKIVTKFEEAKEKLIKNYFEMEQWVSKRITLQSYFREHFKEELTMDNIKNFINYLARKENLDFRPPKSEDKIKAVQIKYGELLMTIKARKINYGEEETTAMILALYFTGHISADEAEKSTGLSKEQIDFIAANGGKSVSEESIFRKYIARKTPYLLKQAFDKKNDKILDYAIEIIKEKTGNKKLKKRNFARNFISVLERMDKVIARMIEGKLIRDWQEYTSRKKVLDSAIILAWEHTTKDYREYKICEEYFRISQENKGKIGNIIVNTIAGAEASDKWQKLSEVKDGPVKIANQIIKYFDNDDRKKLYLEEDIENFLKEYEEIDKKIKLILGDLFSNVEESRYKENYNLYPFLKLFQENEKARAVLTLIFLGHINNQQGVTWLVNNGFDRNNQRFLNNAIRLILDNTKIPIILKLTEQPEMSSFYSSITPIGTILAYIAKNPDSWSAAPVVSGNVIPSFNIEYILGPAIVTGIYAFYWIVNNLKKTRGNSVVGEKLREKNPSLEVSANKFERNILLSL